MDAIKNNSAGTMEKEKLNELWGNAVTLIKERTSPDAFSTWIEPMRPKEIVSSTLTIEVPNHFFVEWISEHYLPLLQECLNEAGGNDLKIQLKPKKFKYEPEQGERRVVVNFGLRLSERYTFESFIVGECNRLAYAACRRVCEGLGKYYNPLLIYGGVGLGKTHLLQSIGNYVKTHNKGVKIFYTAAENFFLELIQSIQEGTTIQFKNKYRANDLLLIDDIHYLTGKERLQEELFHTMNYLHNSGKQIVFTSDKPPKEIPTLQERLSSRLQQGLVCDLQPPDLETRIAILNKKAKEENFNLTPEVAYFIAERVKSNIRELEGCLIKLIAATSIRKEELKKEEVFELLKDLIAEKKPLEVATIIREVAKEFSLQEEELRSAQRNKNISNARQIAMYLIRKLLGLSLKEIGAYFGRKDHTTVIYACERISELKKEEKEIADAIARIIVRLNNM